MQTPCYISPFSRPCYNQTTNNNNNNTNIHYYLSLITLSKYEPIIRLLYLSIAVQLQWTKEPPKEIVVSVNHELKVDCLAQGEPKPQMRWEKLDSSSLIMPNGGGRARSGGLHQTIQPSHSHHGTISATTNADGMSLPIIRNQLATSSEYRSNIIALLLNSP